MGVGIILDAIVYGFIILSFFFFSQDIYFKVDFLNKAQRANTLIKYGIDDLSIFSGTNFEIVTVPTLNDMYTNYKGNGIYLYGNYDKITINDGNYIHQSLYPIQAYYCQENLANMIMCVRIY